jgi:hypothetical protein
LRKSELTKPKNSRIVNGKIDSKLNLDFVPSPPSNRKSSGGTNAKIYKNTNKNDKDDESAFKVYYENNKSLLEKDYPDMPKSDIKTYLRKIWDGMDEEYRKKMCTSNDKNAWHSKNSSLNESETSMEINTTKEESSMEINTTKDDEVSEINTTKESDTSLDTFIKEKKIKTEKIDRENSVSSEQDGLDIKRAKQDNVIILCILYKFKRLPQV